MKLSEEIDREEERIRAIVQDLPDQTKAEYFKRYKEELKDPDTYAVLSYVFFTGLRHLYLGNLRRAAIDLAVGAAGLGLLILWGSLWGLIPFAIIGAFEIADLFRSQRLIKDYNNRTALRLLDELAPGRVNRAG